MLIINFSVVAKPSYKGKERKLDLYSAPLWVARLRSTQVWISQCKLQIHHTRLYLEHSTDGATSLMLAAIWLHLSTPEGWWAELA